MTHAPELAGQTVVVIGGSSGMGLETARRAVEEGAEVIVTGRNAEHLKQAAAQVGARDTAAFDVTDPAALDQFFAGLTGPIDHLYMTAGGPYYAPLAELDFDQARRALDGHLLVPLRIGQHAVGHVRPGGSLLFMSGTGARRPGVRPRARPPRPWARPPCPRWWPTWPWRSPRSGSTPSRPASSTRPCRPGCWARTWTHAARSSAPRCRSAGWSSPPTSRRSPCT